MKAEPTTGGGAAINIGTDADLVMREMAANVKRRRARRLAMGRGGHPLPPMGESRPLNEDEQRRRA